MIINIIEWVLPISYFVVSIISLSIVGIAQKGPSYWPAIRIMALAGGSGTIYFGITYLPIWDRSTEMAFRHPMSLLILNVLLVILLGWALRLIHKQNTLSTVKSVRMDGSVYEPSIEKTRERVQTVARDAQELVEERKHNV